VDDLSVPGGKVAGCDPVRLVVERMAIVMQTKNGPP